MKDGYIKIHRSILKWEWYGDLNTKTVFLHCLLKANWKEGRYQGYEIPRGSFVTGRKKMSEELGMSERSIRTALDHLQNSGELTIKTTNRFSIITIVKWDFYQGDFDEVTNDASNNRPTTDHNRRNKEYKNNIYTRKNGKIHNFAERSYDYDALMQEAKND